MKPLKNLLILSLAVLSVSCVSKKEFIAMQADYETQLETANKDLASCNLALDNCNKKLNSTERDNIKMQTEMTVRGEQITDLRSQIADLQKQRDSQLEQVGDLTVLSKSATSNIDKTLSQLAKKDEYIQYLQLAKNRVDSMNLALAVNLKSVLSKGIADEDVTIKVDKTVVMINLSDKMLYESGSYNITNRADEILAKIATIVQSRPEVEVMVEGYTDNVPISTECLKDNWDLSVMRATSVVRALQDKHNVDPNRLIAAGRGQFNTLAPNDTAEGRSTNRRTRIIIMPKLNQFYDLLNPDKVPAAGADK